MALIFKMDVLSALKEHGYTTYRIRKDKLLSESTVQKLRKGEPLSWENIDTLCQLLHCQPGDLLRHVSDFAPPGEWCVNCKRLGTMILPGSANQCPWCFEYTTVLDEEAGHLRKCDDCLSSSYC